MMTFYRKYRGQTLDEIDLTEVRESLKKIVKSGNIPHAFLFSGPKGTGKTSAARILAKIVNCERIANRARRIVEPCNKCDQCASIAKGTNIDVIELDAASHRGIDDVRALRDAVKLAPATARKKVYIIDEAHMLTLEASNALLKTLEEPPEHVIFILATTNPEKLIETIRSRATNIVFKRATAPEIERSLARVIKGEKIKIDKEAIKVIAEKSEGSFRDAQKTLEQLISEGIDLDVKSVEEFLFNKKVLAISEFVSYLAKKDTKVALAAVEDMIGKGASVENFTAEILSTLRHGLLAKVGLGEETLPDFSKEELVYLIELFTRVSSELKDAVIEQLPVEIAIIEWCSQGTKLEVGSERVDDEARISRIEDRREKAKGQTSNFKSPTSIPTSNLDDKVWRKILAEIKPINSVVEALLRAARPLSFDGRTLTLGVFYRFHKERLETGQHRKVLEGAAATIMGSPVRVVCTLTEPPKTIERQKGEEPTVLTEGEDKDIIKVAEEIFGS